MFFPAMACFISWIDLSTFWYSIFWIVWSVLT